MNLRLVIAFLAVSCHTPTSPPPPEPMPYDVGAHLAKHYAIGLTFEGATSPALSTESYRKLSRILDNFEKDTLLFTTANQSFTNSDFIFVIDAAASGNTTSSIAQKRIARVEAIIHRRLGKYDDFSNVFRTTSSIMIDSPDTFEVVLSVNRLRYDVE